MKVKHNKALLILGILTVVAFVGFILFFNLTITAKGGNFGDFFLAMGDALSSEGFKRLFAPAGGSALDFAFCIANYLIIAFIVVGGIFAIYQLIKTKKYSILVAFVLLILALAPAWAFMLDALPEEPANDYRAFIFETLFKNKYELNDANGGIIALTWFYLIFIVFSFCFSVSFFVLTIMNARLNKYAYAEKSNAKESNDGNDEASILAELEEEPFPDEPEQRSQSSRPIPDPVEEDEYYEDPEDEEEEEEIVCSENDFRNIIQDLIKEALKAELEKRDAERGNQVPNQGPQPPMPQGSGLNNGGPIIVQYFNNNAPGNDKCFQPTNQPYPYGPYPYPYAPYPYGPYPYPNAQQPQPQPASQQPEEQAKSVEQEAQPEPVKEEEKAEEIGEEKQEEICDQTEEEKEPEISLDEPQEEPVAEEISNDENSPEETPSGEQENKEEIEPENVPSEATPVEENKEENVPAEEPNPANVSVQVTVNGVPFEPVEEPVENKEEVTSTPVVEDANEDDNPNKIVRIPFYERILTVDKELQDLYSELKNELLSYGLKSRVAANGDTFRLHRKTYCRISVAGKSLKLHLALNPDDYKDSKMPYADAGGKATYADIPFVFKVKSGLSLRRAKGLIADACAKDDLIQVDLMNTDWIKELKPDSSEEE